MNGQEYILQMKNISKKFSENIVLKGINISLKPGEIHGLLGENGAGKSTLLNILFGMSVIRATGGFKGEIIFESHKVHIESPMEAMKLGIGMVHQEFMLIPSFSITENIKLNREITKNNLLSKILGEKLKSLDFDIMNKQARKALDTLGMDIEEWTEIAGLPVGYMQFVEIAREIDKKNVKLLIFDEPTAVLTENEAANLLNIMKKIANSGIAILFVSHRLKEVMEIADNISVLKDGELVGTKKSADTNAMQLAEMMVGRKITRIQSRKKAKKNNNIILSIKNLEVMMPGEEVHGVTLDIKEGEILGIGGLSGQGKIGIANGIIGLYPSRGNVYLRGTKLPLNNSREVLKKEIGFLSEDRRGVGLLLDSPLELNIAITAIQIKGEFIKKYGFFTQIDEKKIRNNCLKMIKDLGIRCESPTQITSRLSGGNQQKVCIARALTLEPDLLFISEPTRGIDVGAKKLILETLIKLNKESGMTIIMTSSELAELRSICDRIAIVNKGKIMGILKPEDSDMDYALMMSGEHPDVLRREVIKNG